MKDPVPTEKAAPVEKTEPIVTEAPGPAAPEPPKPDKEAKQTATPDKGDPAPAPSGKVVDFAAAREEAGKDKALRLELKKADGKKMDMDFFLETIRRYTDATTITRRMVGELIDHIDVYHAEKRDGVTNQRVVIHYNCIGAFDVPDRRNIPETDIIMETRKGVALSYAPAQIAV